MGIATFDVLIAIQANATYRNPDNLRGLDEIRLDYIDFSLDEAERIDASSLPRYICLGENI